MRLAVCPQKAKKKTESVVHPVVAYEALFSRRSWRMCLVEASPLPILHNIFKNREGDVGDAISRLQRPVLHH